MYYAKIKRYDVSNGPGVRVSLYVSGCRNHCKNCFQPETWDFHYGRPYTRDTEEEILKALEPDYIQGLTLLGGEPMEPENQPALLELVEAVKKRFPAKDIWCYTGFTYETDLRPGGRCHGPCTDRLLSFLDILVDGRFVQEKRNLLLPFRGSENQRIIDMPETLAQGAAVLRDFGRQTS